MATGLPVIDDAYKQAIFQASADILELINREHCGPMLIRLAFHDALTYDAATNTSGANGSIRNKKELAHPGNQGLHIAVELLQPIKAKYPNVTYAGALTLHVCTADLYQLAAMVAVKAAGGPHIPYTPGRRDSWSFPPPGRLPDPTTAEDSVAHLKGVAQRLGLPLRHFVALMGAHCCARWWRDPQPPYFEQFYAAAPRFDNSYFADLAGGRLPKDGHLLADLELRTIIEAYAEDQAIFFADYAVAHEALSLLGTKLPPARVAAAQAVAAQEAAAGQQLQLTPTAQAAVALGAVVLGVVVIGGWYWRRRRRLGAAAP